MMRALAWALALCCCAGYAPAATPRLDVPDGQLGAAGSRVAPNLLLNLSLTFADAQAAYRDSYERSVDYAGYFNARMCYSYPMKRKSASVMEPELDERIGHFSVHKAADARHECGGDSFSGNFLNWATASRLDLLRYALTGGDRVIDEPGLTVLQRAWLPDGAFHPDFYANALYFPRKASPTGAATATVTPFEAGALYVVSCRNRILFSNSAKGGKCDAPRYGASGRRLGSDKYYGEFNARVSVCTADDAASRPALCRAYAGAFKPEGSMQARSAQMRIGLMSYLTQHAAGDANLYGGVLRAPLKFLGPGKFAAPDFGVSANEQAEWDAGSGVLAGNPERAAGAASGAINYINQLGRAQAGRAGAYKSADPGAELFYESLRYLQGREPGAGMGGAADDAGFPVWRTRADPVTAACQRNVVATIGHPSFVLDRYLPGNTRTGHQDGARGADPFAPGVPFDVMQATRRVGEMEADTAGHYGNGAARPDLLGIERADDGPSGSGTFYLAGAAYWAHTNPIRADQPVRIDHYSLELGEAAKPRSSALYLAAKYGGFEDRNGDANPFITSAALANDSEWSAGAGVPAHFFGGAAHDLIANVRALFAHAQAPPGRLAGTAATASRQAGGDFLIQTDYEQAGWSGSVQRFALAPDANGGVRIGAAPLWDAGATLNGDAAGKAPRAPRPAPSAREIHTLVRKPDKSTVTLAFKWDRLPPEQRAQLDLSPLDAKPDGLGEARTEFLRGERTREIGQRDGVFRRRGGVLGDTIHSTPLVVGPPSPSGQGADYGAFHARYKARRAAVYVGANDGMLHAFDAASGLELFAYVPHALVPALNLLSSPSYQHRAYVDGSPGYGEAALNGRWRTVLVSGMGMGARGVFALDVTDPAAFAAGMGALWEFTDKDDPAMGHVGAAPLVAKLKTGTRGGVPEYRYFALVASGVNNGPDDGKASPGALFLLALDKPAAAPWRAGVNYYRFTTPVSDPAQANALAQAALALGPDGSARFAYAGDLQGNLWRFDLSGTAPWANAVGPGKGPVPLFVARDAAGRRQPITHSPKLVFAPGGGYLVMFGTGKFIEAADLLPANFAPQSFYAVHDRAQRPAVVVRDRAELAERTLSGGARYAISGAEFDFGGAERGWYFDFPHAREDGERVVSGTLGGSGALIINSLVPGRDACVAPASRTYVLDALSGFAFDGAGVARDGATSGELTRGSPGAPPMLFEVSTSVGQRNATGRASATRTYAFVRAQHDGAAAPPVLVTTSLPAKRVSWREVANWQELHDAATK